MTHFISRAAIITLFALSMLVGTAEAQIFGGLRRDRNNQSGQNKNQPGQTPLPQPNPAPQPNPSNQPGQPQISGNQPGMQNQEDRDRSVVRDSRRDSTARQYTANRPSDLRAPDMGLWFNRSSRDSLVISDVSSRGPIARLGFREGDRVVSVNGHRVAREADFIDYLLGADRDRVEVIVNRNGRDETIWVEPAQFTQDDSYQQVEPIEQFGVILDDRYDDRIVVWRVIPRSPAFYAGIREGDVIATFDGQPYRSRAEFEKSAGNWRTGEAQLQVRRGDRNRDLTVDVPDFTRSSQDNRSADRNDRSNDRNNDRNQRTGGEQSNLDQANNNDRNQNDRNQSDRGADQMNDKPHGNQPIPNTSGAGGERRDGK
jgi:PDZ domain